MTGSCEVEQHFLCSSVPRFIRFAIVSSVPLLFRSTPYERPMTTKESFSMLFNCFELLVHNSSFPFASHTKSNIDMKMILPVKFSGSHCNSPIILLNLIEDFHYSSPWENLPLEFHRLSINSIQLAEIIVVRMPLNLLLPRFNRIVSHFSQTEHRVGEDIDVGSGILISSTVQ